ncbi:MAG: hypothetical protein WAT19_04265 [Ferruginibacter sp.]
MKKIIFFILAIFNFTLIACNNDSTPERDNTIVPPSAQNSFNTPDSGKPAQLNQVPQPAAVTTSNTAPVTTTAPNVTASPQQAKTAPGMNPPHGQPGHRCDISVGAPLNSAPAASTPAVTSANPPTVTTTTQTPVKTAPGMNPPHGQPGHRCDISVGAPLNSPATNKSAPAANVTPVVADPTGARPQVKEPVKQASDSSKN